ncbi:DUF2933 domain-containing protein [Candidatus Woesearchaeota archaeon]|nr:DUF2933 domain-containing protein [Candidatus Woesearchaeota archaeon]
MTSLYEKIRHNHALLMLICCAVPIILLLVAVYAFAVDRQYIFWAMLLLCPAMHFIMMKDMHKHPAPQEEQKKGKGGCH